MYDTPFDRLDYGMAVWALNLMDRCNGHDFTQDQKVGVLVALFYGGSGGATLSASSHNCESAVRAIAEGLEKIPGFSLFDASILLAKLFDRPREQTMDSLTEIRFGIKVS